MKIFGILLIVVGGFVTLAVYWFFGLIILALGCIIVSLDSGKSSREKPIPPKPSKPKGWAGMQKKPPHSEFDLEAGGKQPRHLGDTSDMKDRP